MASSPLSSQEQVRIRRERRQAKVRDSGTSRLNRITLTQGSDFRKQEAEEEEAARSQAPQTPDPPEVDITGGDEGHVHYPDNSAGRGQDELSEAMILDMFRQQQQRQQQQHPLPQDMLGMDEDPMIKLLQQLTGAPGAGGGGAAGMPPGFGTMPDWGQVEQTEELVVEDWWRPWWRALHAVAAAVLVLWVVELDGRRFNGTEFQRREQTTLTDSQKPQFFWYFATMELILQSSRFLFERGRPPRGTLLTTIGNFLPPPFSTYVLTIARYAAFFTTTLADAAVIIFVLGVVSWWNS